MHIILSNLCLLIKLNKPLKTIPESLLRWICPAVVFSVVWSQNRACLA